MVTKLNIAAATSAITINAWLPSLDAISTFAAQWVPILGAGLLILQIAKLIYDWRKKKEHEPKH